MTDAVHVAGDPTDGDGPVHADVGTGSPWYTSFFDEVYLRVFDPELGPGRTREEVDGVLDVAGTPAGARVLDVACGQGRHAVELARRGYDVTGLDLSPTLLQRARRRADTAGVTVTWLQQDMRTPVDGPPFDLVVNLFNAFGYLEDDGEDQRALDAVGVALVPGGVFVQEVGNREAQIRDTRPAEVHRIDEGLTLVEERDFDLRHSRLRVDYTYVEADRVTRRHHLLRLYTLTELIAMHEAAGLAVLAVHGGWDGTELDLDDPFVVITSRRRA